MPAKRLLTRADILPLEQYARGRDEERRRISALKRARRVEVGPFATFHFENFETVRHQVREMLLIERGGEAQLVDELDAYNPLIPQGQELIATVMFEIDDPGQRDRALQRLGGVENGMFLSVGGERIAGIPDSSRENTSAEGKASAVQFLRFPFTAAQKTLFQTPGTLVLVGIDHANYGHLALLSEAVRSTLAKDFA
jgi:hypothetical protein